MSFDLDAWRERLADTLADGRTSRGERAALRDVLEREAPAPAERHRIRAVAFELARERAPSDALEWLEGVIRLLEEPDRSGLDDDAARAHFSPGFAPLRALEELIDDCRERLEICVFTITDDRLSRAIGRAADRGVAVRIVTDDEKSEDLGSDVDEVFVAHPGITVALDGAGHMHHKYAIFDGTRLATGSFNWTRSATDRNHENLLVLSTPSIVAAYAEEFERLWRSYGR